MRKPAAKAEIETETDTLPGCVSARIVVTVQGATLEDLRQALFDALAGVRDKAGETAKAGVRLRKGKAGA
jgi:hypothetical protein